MVGISAASWKLYAVFGVPMVRRVCVWTCPQSAQLRVVVSTVFVSIAFLVVVLLHFGQRLPLPPTLFSPGARCQVAARRRFSSTVAPGKWTAISLYSLPERPSFVVVAFRSWPRFANWLMLALTVWPLRPTFSAMVLQLTGRASGSASEVMPSPAAAATSKASP